MQSNKIVTDGVSPGRGAEKRRAGLNARSPDAVIEKRGKNSVIVYPLFATAYPLYTFIVIE
jgi:hypothetical protein